MHPTLRQKVLFWVAKKLHPYLPDIPPVFDIDALIHLIELKRLRSIGQYDYFITITDVGRPPNCEDYRANYPSFKLKPAGGGSFKDRKGPLELYTTGDKEIKVEGVPHLKLERLFIACGGTRNDAHVMRVSGQLTEILTDIQRQELQRLETERLTEKERNAVIDRVSAELDHV